MRGSEKGRMNCQFFLTDMSSKSISVVSYLKEWGIEEEVSKICLRQLTYQIIV